METKERIIYKPVAEIEVEGMWCEAGHLAYGLDMFLSDSNESANVWNALRDYEIELDWDILQHLVKIGLIRHDIGERMSDRYWIKKGKTKEVENLRDKCYEAIEKANDNNNIPLENIIVSVDKLVSDGLSFKEINERLKINKVFEENKNDD